MPGFVPCQIPPLAALDPPLEGFRGGAEDPKLIANRCQESASDDRHTRRAAESGRRKAEFRINRLAASRRRMLPPASISLQMDHRPCHRQAGA